MIAYLLFGQKESSKMVRTWSTEDNLLTMVRITTYCEVGVITYLLSGQKESRRMVRSRAYCEVKVMAGTTCWLPVR